MSFNQLIQESLSDTKRVPDDELLLEFFGNGAGLFSKGETRKQAIYIVKRLVDVNRLVDTAVTRRGFISDEQAAHVAFDLIDEVYADIDKLVDMLSTGQKKAGMFRKRIKSSELKVIYDELQRPLDRLIAAIDKS